MTKSYTYDVHNAVNGYNGYCALYLLLVFSVTVALLDLLFGKWTLYSGGNGPIKSIAILLVFVISPTQHEGVKLNT